MVVPTVTIRELSDATQDVTLSANTRKVLEGILNDYMDLQFGKETAYTTGDRVLPNGVRIQNVDAAAADDAVEKKFKDVFMKISETYKSGDFTPQSIADGWNPKFTPALVVVRPDD